MKEYGIGNPLTFYAVFVKRTSRKKVSWRLDGVIGMDKLSVTLVLNTRATLRVLLEVSIESADSSNTSFYSGLPLLGSCQYCGLVALYRTRQVCSNLPMNLRIHLISIPYTDDPNLNTYEANEGHRISPTGELQRPHRSNTRSRSYAGIPSEGQQESSLEQTVGEMKRLRSTRNERTLSTTFKKARASRVVDGPEGRSARPGSAGADPSNPNQDFQIVEEQDANGETVTELTFGNQDSLTLDDIPRIVAAEQAKEQRPNAYKHAGTGLVGAGDPPAKLLNGNRRMSGHMDNLVQEPTPIRNKRYFSELSALEYFIVRHVAVLSMEPLLEGQFNLEELLGLIESRKPTIWNIFGRAFKNDGRKGGKKKGIFGTPLDMLVERDGAESTHGVGPGALRVPALVDDAVSAMRQMDMSVEGVFRKNGNIRRLKDLSDMIDNKYDQVDLSRENPVQVAALLKKFLREMPDPLLTFKLHRLFVISQSMIPALLILLLRLKTDIYQTEIQDPEKQRRILHLTCCLLPKPHRDTLEVLFSFLNWTASFSHVDEESGSKMDVHNLATVMTPNILYASNKGPGVDDSFLAIEAVTKLIAYNDFMCEVSTPPTNEDMWHQHLTPYRSQKISSRF